MESAEKSEMNINHKLQKIGRDLQEISLEMGAKITEFNKARSPDRYHKGDYVRLYHKEGSMSIWKGTRIILIDKLKDKFYVGRIYNKPIKQLMEDTEKLRNWNYDRDGDPEEVLDHHDLEYLWTVGIIYEDDNGRFWKSTNTDWSTAKSWMIDPDSRYYKKVLRKKVTKPKDWNPPKNIK